MIYYLITLILSYSVRHLIHKKHLKITPLNWKEKNLPTYKKGKQYKKAIKLRYKSFPNSPNKPYLLMIHGSPRSSVSQKKLVNKLKNHFNIILPDLPGFGNSQKFIPDYSMKAHAFYLKKLLEELKINDLSILGYSQGGGVALSILAIKENLKINNLILLSSIGPIETELLGNYYLNRLVYSIYYIPFTLLYYLFPHFGLLDWWLYGISFIRNFWDSDQRPLRELLENNDINTLIIHGKEDHLVPTITAFEANKLSKNSLLHLLPGEHMEVINKPKTIAKLILDFSKNSLLKTVDSNQVKKCSAKTQCLYTIFKGILPWLKIKI